MSESFKSLKKRLPVNQNGKLKKKKERKINIKAFRGMEKKVKRNVLKIRNKKKMELVQRVAITFDDY